MIELFTHTGSMAALVENSDHFMAVDLEGAQQQQSLGLASLVSKFIGVPLGEFNRLVFRRP